ncbi:MAG: acyl carrier protein [Chitinispirillaceae bacterium]
MHADPKSIADTIDSFIKQTFPRARTAQYTPSEHLVNRGIVDSMGLLSIIMFLEEHFNFMVSDEEVTDAHFASVEKLVAYVYAKLDKVGAAR